MKRPNRPNILLIAADQWRYDYLGSAGADFLDTPNLDRLSREGTSVPHCYSNSPVCVPARIGLATGRFPWKLGSIDNSSYLAPGTPTYYQRLRDVGYRVGAVGKLDLAKPDRYNGRRGDRPCLYQWGFTHPEEIEGKEHSLMGPEPMGPYGHRLEELGLYRRYYEERKAMRGTRSWFTPSKLPSETFLDSYQGNRAVQWLEQITDDYPWHLFVSFSGPHRPHDPPEEFADRYRERHMPDPVVGEGASWRPRGGSWPSDPEEIRNTRRMYCAYIELIDTWIGRILDVLDRRGFRDSTYIVFTSDHGEMLGDLDLYAKCLPYDPSLRVPLIAAGPTIETGAQSDTMVTLSDIGPTFLDLAGAPEIVGIDGRSFLPVLEEPTRELRDHVVAVMRNWQCVRTKEYKLIENYNGPVELYDLSKDPFERDNLVTASPPPEVSARAKELQSLLRAQNHVSPYGQPRSADSEPANRDGGEC